MLFRKSCRLWNNVEKCDGAREAINGDTMGRIRVVCWISTVTRKHSRVHTNAPGQTHAYTRARTHRQICNTYCFSTATMVSWTRLIVTLHVLCLSCFLWKGNPKNEVRASQVKYVWVIHCLWFICAHISLHYWFDTAAMSRNYLQTTLKFASSFIKSKTVALRRKITPGNPFLVKHRSSKMS